MKIKTFTAEERLSLDRLKQRGVSRSADKTLHKPLEARAEPFNAMNTGKEWVNNLLETKNNDNTDFERAIVKRGAARFAEWVERELKEK
jgi:hypothetical protein